MRNAIICEAIRDRKLLSFSYDGYPRVVEPYAHGESTAGNPVLRCYQVSGSGSDGSGTGWHLMIVSKIEGLRNEGSSFSATRGGYRRGDRGMSTIYCEH